MRMSLMVSALMLWSWSASAEDAQSECASKTNVLGVSRVAEIDTTGGKQFGVPYPPSGLLQKGEVVLTFDDGPHRTYTREILAALKAECTKATFFNVGEMVKDYPDVAREVEAAGHTIGTHTWSHPNLAAMSLDAAKLQIESTFAIEDRTLRGRAAPFFRFPYLNAPQDVVNYLSTRNIAVLSIDVDSSDWRTHSPASIVENVMHGLASKGSGIILFHDIHGQTAQALPTVLKELRAHGYKVVHLVSKEPVQSIAVGEPPAKEPQQRQARRRYAVRRRH